MATGTGLTLGELVARSGVPASTVHHYRRAGLLATGQLGPGEAHRGRFHYSEGDLEALQHIRLLREEQGLSLSEIKEVLPAVMEGREPPAHRDGCDGPQSRLLEAAFTLFSAPKGYTAVTVSEIAAAAGVAKGSVYRYFQSKEALFTAVVEDLCEDTAERFARTVAELGGAEGLGRDPARAALLFGAHVARAMPILLELGARAARGDPPSQHLAARVLRTLAEAAGRPLSEDPVPAGLQVIEAAFATVLRWAVGPEWVDGPTA